MLYSIIPPILIVISLAGIIIFLMKKAPAVADLKEEEYQSGKDKLASQEKNFWTKFKRQSGERGGDFGHKTLLFLEKNVKKLKVFFLKLENIFAGLAESIKNKRKAREEGNVVRLAQITQEKIESKEESEKESDASRDEEKSEDVLKLNKLEAENKIEKKDILEKILVERIAANPKDIEAYERLGEYYLEIENWNYAKECFKQVLKLNPKNESVKGKMKRLEKMLGR